MRNYSKTGGKQGKPGYRTASSFGIKKRASLKKYGRKNKCLTPKCRSDFSMKVIEVVSKIPKGETLSYKDVAEKAGNEKASRAVGNILNKNYCPEVPCHRVIRSDGSYGGYNRGTKKKMIKLEEEKN